MPVYIALLRGINIGPHKRIQMEKLRASLEGLGFRQVKTYIQSGNAVFVASKTSSPSLRKKIEGRLLDDFGFSVAVMVRTREEMEKVVRGNLLLKEKAVDPAKLHVAFLSEAPGATAMEKLQSLTAAPDRAWGLDKELYFCFPNGVSGSSLWKHPLDRVLGVNVTMRNWNTVNELCVMARELK